MRTIIFFLINLLSLSIFAQTEFSTNFNSTASGRNISLLFSKTNNRHEIGGGLRYNIGKIAMPDDQGNLYYKRLYPSSFGQHLGLHTFYNYYILNNWEHLTPFLFFDLQGASSTTRTSYAGQSEAKRYGPFTWMEQYIGIGYKVDLPQSFFITQKIGGGGILIFGSDETLLKEKAAWEFGGILNIGIGYRFK